MGMGIDGEWQTCNDSWTIRECHSPNGKANDHRWNSEENSEESRLFTRANLVLRLASQVLIGQLLFN